jgi:glycosidase
MRVFLKRQCVAVAFLTLFVCGDADALTVTWLTHDAVVWSRTQTVEGMASGSYNRDGTLYVNGLAVPFQIPADSFAVSITIGEGTSIVVAAVDSGGVLTYSDTLRLTLGYRLRPELLAYASGGGSLVQLHAAVIDNPDSATVAFSWSQDASNPLQLSIANAADSVASLTLPQPGPAGEYYFTVRGIASDGDTVTARTYITYDSTGARPAQIEYDHARWIDTAVVYGITPYIFVINGRFADITAKLPEIAQLGATAIWVQPIYTTHGGGQGYDVTDYFGVRSDLGSEADLHQLITEAHANGLRVLFDFVPNHTSIYHPYALESAQLGIRSHYYTFYQRTDDGAPYSQHYKYYQGFVNYFWNELPNLNYDNPEVARMVTEAGKYWIEKFDIDGYRIDVAWGPNARKPEFMQQWRLAMKRFKPEILLLGEDKATWPSVFDKRFDVAYDWAPEQSWVSHWVWQTTYSTTGNPTIFNYTDQTKRSSLLRTAMTNNGSGYAPGAKIFRFMENNDTFRFLPTHDLARTKMVAAMMFSLDGVPLIYNGQEIGAPTHPYNTSFIFQRQSSMQSQDKYALFPFYQQLSTMRHRWSALSSTNFSEVTVTPGTSVYAYRRWAEKENVVVVMNMGNAAASVTVNIPAASMGLDSNRTYILSDLIANVTMPATPVQMGALQMTLPAYTTRVFLIDTVAVLGVQEPSVAVSVPSEFALEQNYPNPFNPTTKIQFTIVDRQLTIVNVYDLMGREVAVLVNEVKDPGTYTVEFNASNLASGVYFYRIETPGHTAVRKMVALR